MSAIQDYIEYIIKRHETLTVIPPIHIYTNSINKRLLFKMKDLETPETMKLFGTTKNLTCKTKNGEKRPRYKVFEEVLVQCNVM